MKRDLSSLWWRQLDALRAEPFAAEADAALLRRFVDLQDAPAFEELVRRHGAMVWAVCRQTVGDRADAEDAFQAAFMALVQSAGTIRNGNVGAWLHGAAVRGGLKLRRAAARRRRRDERVARPEAEAADPEGGWNELLAAVHEEVERLPEALRTAFVVCDLEGVPQPEALVRLGWKAGTLTGRLSKARKRLLAALTRRGLAPAAGLVGVGAATSSAEVPLKLLITVLKFPGAAPQALPLALLTLAQEIVPMTLSKVKLLALTAMLACGLTAGTGGVIVRIADAQAPPVAKPADPAKPPAAKTPTADEQKWAPDLIPPAPKSAEFEYKYTLKNLIPDRLSGFKARLEEEASKGWEFSGMITTSMTAKELSELAGRPGSDELERTVVGETAVLVFKKRKPAPAMPSEPGIGALLGLADPVPTPIAKPARAQVIAPEGFTVQHSYSFAGITKTTVYEKGAVVAPEHYRSMAPAGALMLRFRSESANDAAATLRRMFDKPVHVGVDDASNTLIVSDATPEQKATIIQLTVNFDDSPKAANPVPFPAPPRVRAAEATSSEQVAVCTKGFDVTEKPTNGINMAYNYAPGDTIRARHLPYAGTNYTMLDASLVESFKPKLAPNGKPYVRAAGQSSTLVIVPVGEILTLKLKTLNAEAVAAMCREALPKTAEVYTEQMTNSISVNNATPADLEKLKRMIEVIDKPAATPAPTVTQELAAPNVVPVPAARDPLLSERLSPQDVAPRPAGRTTGQQGSTRGAGRPEPVPTQAQPAEPEKFDPVVLRLKHIDAPTAAMLGNQVVMPPARRAGFNTGGVEAERVVALQASNSIVIFNTPPADVERIRKLLNEIDKPATQPRPMADSPAGAYYVPQMQHRLVRPGDDAIPDERGLPSPRQYDSRPPQLDLPSASAPSADRVPPQVMPTRPPALFDERPPQLDLLSPVLPSPVRGTDSPPPSAAKPKKPKGKATIPPAADNVPQVTPERIHGGTL